MKKLLAPLLVALLVPASVSVAQDSLAARGHRLMGFDQAKTQHRFELFLDGGGIDVRARDASDRESMAEVRMHLDHLPTMFGAGDFSTPMGVHDQVVPGTKEMAALRDRIRYRYSETPLGGRVDIIATDPVAIAAIHQFLRFQIEDHRTGDDPTPRARPSSG